jgi:hypothetical protein
MGVGCSGHAPAKRAKLPLSPNPVHSLLHCSKIAKHEIPRALGIRYAPYLLPLARYAGRHQLPQRAWLVEANKIDDVIAKGMLPAKLKV